jgi:hypothetical protein
MTHPRETRKLAELRAKTDRQLLVLVSKQLDRALALAEAGECVIRAKEIYREVRRLLPLAESANHAEWCRLAARMKRLREVLDSYSVAHWVA